MRYIKRFELQLNLKVFLIWRCENQKKWEKTETVKARDCSTQTARAATRSARLSILLRNLGTAVSAALETLRNRGKPPQNTFLNAPQRLYFTSSPLHCLTVSLLHCFTPSLLHCFTASLPHHRTASLLHYLTTALLHCFTPSLLHSFTPSLSHY